MHWSQILIIIGVAVFAYLFGNINFAVIISKFLKKDIRKLDSGNPGSMNMIRNFGKPIGAITIALEALKGAIPSLLGWLLVGGIGFTAAGTVNYMRFGILFIAGAPRLGAFIGGFFVMLGHVFPVFFKFKGGKGIAAAMGVGVIAQPVLTVVAFFVGFAFLAVTQLGAITSFLIISIPIAIEGFLISSSIQIFIDLGGNHYAYAVASLAILFILFMFTIFTHRSNIVKLFLGTEKKTRLVKTKAEREAKRVQRLANETKEK